ncbi:hypothetical protein Sliba_35350 [Streptomyces nigrescens]|uniref:Uncharacterized protein n=1 Tax=Streptomyces nigrescens TaxID=1920 RepID=A0A640TJJ3_STRNI|nr:hypothetical protein Sliba_35350 [Streptomyces libani subsp. libani]GGV92105.1 hypothetical protein GCM10010500_24050 [Streptomyces libani subsp. libani]
MDHLSRNRAYTNPARLAGVTNQTNILRGVGFCASRAQQCVHDHACTVANTCRSERHPQVPNVPAITSRRALHRRREVTYAAA